MQDNVSDTITSAFVLSGGQVFNGVDKALKTSNVFVREGLIAEVSSRDPNPGDGKNYSVQGKVIMPGLIDAHIHAYATSVSVYKIVGDPPTTHGAWAARMLQRMLARGFTTVRDTGGADYGLWLALERGYFKGPRLYYCGYALSQTGGHGDFRNPHVHDHHDEDLLACGCGHHSRLSIVVDGVDAVRRAVRENLRRGATFIKLMGSGGVSSTGDKLESAQFSDDEIRAIVDEVERDHVYCTAHIHPDLAIRRAINLGVHCIEHGTLIEPDTAQLAAERGTNIVPTMAIIAALAKRGAELGYPPQSLAKLEKVKDEAVRRLQHMKDAGVRVGFGTDLLGELEDEQCTEWSLRSEIFSNYELLKQATSVNAEIIGEKGRLGVLQSGAYADALVIDGNPLKDISLLQDDGAHMSMIIKDGQIVKNEI